MQQEGETDQEMQEMIVQCMGGYLKTFKSGFLGLYNQTPLAEHYMSWLVRGVSPWRSWVALTSVRCSAGLGGGNTNTDCAVRVLRHCGTLWRGSSAAGATFSARFAAWLPPASLFQLFSPQGRGCEPQQCWHLVILRSQRKSDRQRCTVLGRALTAAGRPLPLWRPVRAQPIGANWQQRQLTDAGAAQARWTS